jgi:integrase
MTKQAKILTDAQIKAALATVTDPSDRIMIVLSVKAGLRACEIAALTWPMVTDAEGALADVIALPDVLIGPGPLTVPANRTILTLPGQSGRGKMAGGHSMRRSFYFIQFLNAQGWNVGATCETLRVARKRARWYTEMSGVSSVKIMRGGQGAELVETVQ